MRFVVVSVPRTGSSILLQNLNSHPDVLMHGEIFHPDAHDHILEPVLGQIDLQRRIDDPHGFVEDIYRMDLGKKAIGFKIFEGHKNDVLHALLLDQNVKKIILRRDNYLAMYSSLLIAKALNYWNDAYPKGVVEKKVEFNGKHFEKFMAYYEHCFTNWKQTIIDNNNQPHLEIQYCPDDSMIASSRALVGFLGLNPDALTVGRFKKLNNRSVADRFTDPESVKKFLEGIGRPEWAVE